MGHSQAEKAQSRERIVTEAARQMRHAGLESVGVGSVMKSVGLTHGGFYGHFASRAALLVEALKQALADGAAKGRSTVAGRSRSMAAIARSYLSRAHRDERETGCAIAALAGDVGRADTAVRQAMETHVEAFVDAVAETLGGDRERARVAVSAMVGALALSRVLTNAEQSDAFLRTVRDYVSAFATGDSA